MKFVTNAMWSNLDAQIPVSRPEQRQQQGGVEAVEQGGRRMMQLDRHEHRHRRRHRDADDQAAGDAGHGEAEGQLGRRQRRHQDVDDVALDLHDQHAARRIGEGVLHGRHDHQAGGEELQVGNPGDDFRVTAQRQREHRQEQQGRDHRRHHGLAEDLVEALHFPAVHRPDADPVDRADPARRSKTERRRHDGHKLI